jgi:hypothetical protein
MKPQKDDPITLLDFILHGKISGYASGGEGQEKTFDDGSRGFEFTKDGYRYLDRYYGFNPFTGTEQIYTVNGPLLWVMNYYGQVLPRCTDPMKVYTFLKEAMRLVSPEYPFRGPALFEKGGLMYENQQHGTLDSFHGTESIFENHEKVYILHYHGGKVAAPETTPK